jgi:uncharacterized repeat protein (TIGR03809 family)
MINRTDLATGREIVARWCALAEARLDHLTELFESGRWRRYHSERAFLENVKEAKAAVETWRNLLKREASLDNSPIDISWLGRGRSAARGEEIRPAVVPAPRPADVKPALHFVTASKVEVAPETTDLSKPKLPEMPPPTLDLRVMQERYPLLRNAL